MIILRWMSGMIREDKLWNEYIRGSIEVASIALQEKIE